MFKDKMRMDDTTFKALQTSIRKVTSKKFDKSKTARSQPSEIMQAIKDEVMKTHSNLLAKYDEEWPVHVLTIAYIENRAAYERRRHNLQLQRDRVKKDTRRASSQGVSDDSGDGAIVLTLTYTGSNMEIDQYSGASASAQTPLRITDETPYSVKQHFVAVLVAAAKEGCHDIVLALLNAGVEADGTIGVDDFALFDIAYETALGAAILHRRPEIVTTLLKNGAHFS
ncbi:hypothetical protein K488DRAFT_74968 [Vararia minispora EC-137]|uniref:Uncharacterized protein n=1 Tax=Vararia minispora EC-137 TaxID=1314806 RepID=A0ACB8Q571_9AGAM|nr:hypothetical protein K488DRAFT_74968 [Vararia minispora EC-137]